MPDGLSSPANCDTQAEKYQYQYMYCIEYFQYQWGKRFEGIQSTFIERGIYQCQVNLVHFVNLVHLCKVNCLDNSWETLKAVP